jgi:propionate catabolism operon transcriptional regulator
MSTEVIKMEPRIAVMSYDRLTKAITSIIPREQLDKLMIINSSFEETKKIAEKIWNDGKIDVFVSASSNLQVIKERISAPIIPIQVSGFDILSNLVKAKSYGNKIAIISYEETIANLDSYKTILNIDLEEIRYRNLLELKVILKNLKEKGVSAVIGSSLVCDLCDEMGINSIFIYSYNSIRDAIAQAIQLQKSIENEKYRIKQLDTILSYAYSGILATDEHNIIQVFNPMAEKILGISKEKAIGKEVSSVIENTRLHKVLVSEQEEIDQIQKVNDKTILTSRVPIIVEGKVKGVVATFQDIKFIQNAEHKIRRELYTKGLTAKYTFSDIKGSSKAILDCIATAREYAKSDFTVLITGESGTGKELFAQSIHNESRRKDEAFVAVNCAALPESLLESELFGYEEGAFTGAKRGGKPGLFELAHNGTIFLDEISELPLNLQARLLRVIQEKEIMRLGSDKIIPIDVRIISATNRNLWQQVEQGKFREDLYYRLSVLEIIIPPLRERKQDIPDISRNYIMHNFPNLFSVYEKRWEKLFKLLDAYDFYGNVRELQNLLNRLAVTLVSERAKYLSEEELISILYNNEKIKKSLFYKKIVKIKKLTEYWMY